MKQRMRDARRGDMEGITIVVRECKAKVQEDSSP